MLNEESKTRIKEFTKELRALLDQKDLIFWQGGIVRVAPVGAPPVFCTVEIQGIWDENVEWRGTPGGLVAGDAVLVWEDPITHRREIIGASGAGACTPFVHDHSLIIQGGDALNPATISQQTFIVGPAPCPYPTVSAAVVAVNAFGPTAANPCTIRVQGCVTTEPAALTIPQYCNLEGVGEGSIVDLQAQYVDFEDYTSALDIVFTSSQVGAGIVVVGGETDVELRNVKSIATNGGHCFHIASSTFIRLFDCIAEATLANSRGFHIGGTASDVDLEGCTADTTNFAFAYYMSETASATTKFCTFKGSNDVRIEVNTAWEDVGSRLDYGNCQLLGTVTHLSQSVASSDTFAFRAKNTSGGAASRGDVGYIDVAGEYKTTATAYLDAAWCVVLIGGANNADIYVARRGRVPVTLNGNCAIGDFLYTSTTAGQAQPLSYCRPEIFAVALTANAAGAGGTCEALLHCNRRTYPYASANNTWAGSTITSSAWASTINGAPVGAVVTYNVPVAGNADSIDTTAAANEGKLVLHNTTRGDSALISTVNVGANTITLTAAAPGAWANADVIQVNSLTCIAPGVPYAFDLDLSGILPTNATGITMYMYVKDTGGAGASGNVIPYEAWGSGKVVSQWTQVANANISIVTHVKAVNRIMCTRYASTGASTLTVVYRLRGYEVAEP